MVAIQGDELRKMFWAAMPRNYMEEVLALLVESYRTAEEACRGKLNFEPSEADNVRWTIRRGFIERGMRDLIKPHMRAEVVYGRDQPVPHPWNHTLITVGNVLMTQCSVQQYDQMVRLSLSREIYSLPNKEQFLFPEMRKARKTNNNPLYAILVHGRENGTVDQLGFAYVRFPKQGMQEWYPEKINLLDEFGGGSALPAPKPRLAPVPEEPVLDPQEPEIRRPSDSA